MSAKTRTLSVVILNLASALCGFTGIGLSLAVNGVSCLAMYTDQVALFSGIISIYLAVSLLMFSRDNTSNLSAQAQANNSDNRQGYEDRKMSSSRRSITGSQQPASKLTHRMTFLRFASAVPQIVLIIAALISFLPAFTFPFNVRSPHLILMHFCAPALSLLSYFGFEPNASLRFRDTGYAMVYTLIYAAAAIAVTASGLYHSEAYPFLDFHHGHIAAPILEDIAILLAVYLIDFLVYKFSVSRPRNP